MKTEDAKQIWEKDRRHFVHPYQHFASFEKEGSLVVSRGRGCYITDADGKEYFDAVGGMWCTNIGLGRPEMAEAIARQVTDLAYANPFTDMTNPPAAELSEKLARLAPGDLNHVIYTSGGSTANEMAFRLIQFYQASRGRPEKKHILSLFDSYHGGTYFAASLSGKTGDRLSQFEFMEDVIHHLTSPNFYRAPEGITDEEAFCDYLIEEMETKILEIGADRVAAYWAEPILGSGGVIVPPEGYHRRVFELCRKYDMLYVADEVVTGFGRLGHWFVSKEMFGVEPDILLCAKGITSGYLPLGACIFSDRIYDVISQGEDKCLAMGFTYSGHPVACAAALKNIEIMEREKILGNVREVGPYFRRQLHSLLDLPIVGDIRGARFMMCVVNVRDKESREFFAPEVNIGKRISNRAEELGLLVRPIADLNVMSPPLTMTKSDVDFVVSRLRQAIELTLADLRREGIWRG